MLLTGPSSQPRRSAGRVAGSLMRVKGWLARTLWITVTLLALIGLLAVTRRAVHVISVITSGYQPPRNPVSAQTDNGFEKHPVLTLVHIIPGGLFMILGPLQFNRRIRARHLAFHRWSGRVFVA